MHSRPNLHVHLLSHTDTGDGGGSDVAVIAGAVAAAVVITAAVVVAVVIFCRGLCVKG